MPVVSETRRFITQGGAGNVAENLKALGAEVTFWYGEKSSHKMRIVAGHQHVVRLDKDDLTEVPSPGMLEDWVYYVDLVVVSDYCKGVVTEEMLELLNEYCSIYGKPLMVDPYNGRCNYGAAVTLIKPNRYECQSVTGIKIVDNTSLHESAQKYLQMSKAKHLVVTLGAEGMVLFYSDNKVEPYHSRCEPRQIFDVTGAGDTAMATLAYIWALPEGGKLSKRSSVDWAAKAASLAVEKLGTSVIGYKELFGENFNNKEK